MREQLLRVWQTLPKNRHDRVEWRLLRHLVHRYFSSQFNMLVLGLEPTRQVTGDDRGEAKVLQRVPALAARLLDQPVTERGFNFEDAVVVTAALGRLLADSDSEVLEEVFARRRIGQRSVDSRELQDIMKEYAIAWLLGEDDASRAALLQDESRLEETLPTWPDVAFMVQGAVRSMDHWRKRLPSPGQAQSASPNRYTFEDAQELASGISQNFSSFWETECRAIKASLVAFDRGRTGRVRLADFYGANLKGEWRFGESEAYLRQLGALDESSLWEGTQVIIPNYLQAASNCIVMRPHYLVCCANECAGILEELEGAVGAPAATAAKILEVVGNLTASDDAAVTVDKALAAQLARIAAMHGGEIPLHGRLLAQWLHYVFPRDCPFPHKAGKAGAVTPADFGDDYSVTPEDVKRLTAERGGDIGGGRGGGADGAPWMTLWTDDEELPGDYSAQLQAPWQRRGPALAMAGAATAGTAAMAVLWAKLGFDPRDPYAPGKRHSV